MPTPEILRWMPLVQELAPADLTNDPVFLGIALGTITAESGGDPNVVGDQGHSIGLMQLHDQGLGSGLSVQQRRDPRTNLGRGVAQLAQAYRAARAQGLQGDRLVGETYRAAINPGAVFGGPQITAVVGYTRDLVTATGGGKTGKGTRGLAAPLREGDEMAPENTEGLPPGFTPDPGAPASVVGDRTGQAAHDNLTNMRASADRLEKEIARQTAIANQTEADGTPTAAAFTARARLGDLEVEYGRTLRAIQDAEAKTRSPEDIALKRAQIAEINARTAALTSARRKPDLTPQEAARIDSEIKRNEAQIKEIETRTAGLKAAPKPSIISGAGTGERYIPIQQPDGTIAWVENKNYREPAAPKTAEPTGVAALFQSQHDAIERIRVLLASGQMTPAEADQYITSIKSYTTAALAGTTPYQQERNKVTDEQARRELGRSILNQRVASGSSLAQGLISAASSAASGTLAPRDGRRLRFDPFGSAERYVDRMGGGPEVGALGKELLTGATGARTAAAPAGVAPAAGHPDFPTTPEAVRARYPNLFGAAPAVTDETMTNLATARRAA